MGAQGAQGDHGDYGYRGDQGNWGEDGEYGESSERGATARVWLPALRGGVRSQKGPGCNRWFNGTFLIGKCSI
jgi:hypothetical protein